MRSLYAWGRRVEHVTEGILARWTEFPVIEHMLGGNGDAVTESICLLLWSIRGFSGKPVSEETARFIAMYCHPIGPIFPGETQTM